MMATRARWLISARGGAVPRVRRGTATTVTSVPTIRANQPAVVLMLITRVVATTTTLAPPKIPAWREIAWEVPRAFVTTAMAVPMTAVIPGRAATIQTIPRPAMMVTPALPQTPAAMVPVRGARRLIATTEMCAPTMGVNWVGVVSVSTFRVLAMTATLVQPATAAAPGPA
jgi:hypothetical protein